MPIRHILFKLNHIKSSALASATMMSGFIFSIPLFLSEPQSFSFNLSLKTYLATLFLGLVSSGISLLLTLFCYKDPPQFKPLR